MPSSEPSLPESTASGPAGLHERTRPGRIESHPTGAPVGAAVHVALMLTMACWGMNFAVMKVLAEHFDAGHIAFLRMAVGSATFALLVRWRRLRWPRLSRRQWVGVLSCGVLMVYLNQLCFSGGMVRTTATNGTLILATAPLVSGLFAAWVFGEPLTARRLLGVALGFAGVVVVVLQRPGATYGSAGFGDLLLLASVVCTAGGGLLVQRMAPRLDALLLTFAAYGVGTVLLGLHLLAEQAGTLSVARLFPGWWPWALVLYSGITATALGNWVWSDAIARIGVARTSLFTYWVPLFGIGFAVALLGEPLSPWHAVGLALVLGGSWFGLRRAVPA